MLFTVPSQRSFSTEQLDQRLRAGLVGHWIGGGSGLTWMDRSGYGNHGTLTNGPVWTLGPRGTQAGMSFDGSDDFVGVGSGVVLSGQCTAAAWVCFRSLSSTGVIFSNTTAGGSGLEFQFEAGRTSGKLSVVWDNAVIGYNTTTLSISQWYHVAIVRSGSAGSWTATFYLNGSKDGSASTASNPIASGVAYSIGRPGAFNAQYLNAITADVRAYNRALSAAEVALLASPSFSPVIQPPRFSVGNIATGLVNLVGSSFRLAGNGGGLAG